METPVPVLYAVYLGFDYEPGEIGGVFSSKEKAEKYVLDAGFCPTTNGQYEMIFGGRYAYIDTFTVDEGQ